MYLEQGLMVVEMDDAEMAGDVAPFIEEAQNMVNEVKPILVAVALHQHRKKHLLKKFPQKNHQPKKHLLNKKK